MKYIGDLYGKWDRRYIKLVMTSEDVVALEEKAKHLEEAFINADRLRTTYQLQVETLHDAILAFEQARGRYHTQKACEALLALALTQRTANQP